MSVSIAARCARGVEYSIAAVGLALVSGTASAQTDYFNTDRGRPLHVQDAVAIERYAFEFQAAPIRITRLPGARGVWSVEPELAYGVLPRTQFEVGVPVFVTEGFGTGPRSGIGALHLSVLHALNTETLGLPALAMNAALSIPAGSFGPQRTYPTLGLIATRTTSLARIHLNVDGTLGSELASDDSLLSGPRGVGYDDLSRWMAGVAVDRTLPLRSMLLGAEVVARQPLIEDADLEWQAAAGVRWQLAPQWALDAGVGRSLGEDAEWSITLGAACSFGLIQFFPRSR